MSIESILIEVHVLSWGEWEMFQNRTSVDAAVDIAADAAGLGLDEGETARLVVEHSGGLFDEAEVHFDEGRIAVILAPAEAAAALDLGPGREAAEATPRRATPLAA